MTEGKQTTGQSIVTEMQKAILSGDFEAAKDLLESGRFPINQTNEKNTNVLQWFAGSNDGFLKMMRLFMESKADVNHIDDDGWSPLLMSAAHGQYEVTKLLLEFKADISTKWGGYTAKSLSKHEKIVKLLTEAESIQAPPEAPPAPPILPPA